MRLTALKTSCGWQYPSKRSALFGSRDVKDDDTFSTVDHEGSGNITLDQFTQHMDGKNPGMQRSLPSQEDWAAWFAK